MATIFPVEFEDSIVELAQAFGSILERACPCARPGYCIAVTLRLARGCQACRGEDGEKS
jgi:hypothetical protein